MTHHLTGGFRFLSFLLGLSQFLSISSLAQNPVLPSDQEQNQLIKETLQSFSDSVKLKDFTQFHQHLAKPFKEKYTPDDLKKAFQGFIDQELDLTSVLPQTPILNEAPDIDSDGVLRLTGHYNTSPNTLFFDLKFYEYPSWKLLSIDIRVFDDPKLKLPTQETQMKLVKDSIDAFARAVKTDDFTDFHENLSEPFRKEYTPESLKEAFKEFIEKKIDLTDLSTHTPIFHQAPFLDEDDVLTITGHYETQPYQTNFVLKFYERPYWRLLSIDVHIQ